jgi:hypothetical protein
MHEPTAAQPLRHQALLKRFETILTVGVLQGGRKFNGWSSEAANSVADESVHRLAGDWIAGGQLPMTDGDTS